MVKKTKYYSIEVIHHQWTQCLLDQEGRDWRKKAISEFSAWLEERL